MADTKAAGCAGEPAVRDQHHLVAHALAVKGRGGRQHFAHAGPALGTFIADHQNLAFLVIAVRDRI